MTPYICQVKHDPPESYGDCLRACIASLLDREPPRVPHFTHDGCDFETQIERLREWLASEGMGFYLAHHSAHEQVQDVLDYMGMRNPNMYYLLFSENHVVVCRDNKIAHDPAWYKTALTQPSEAWTVAVITHG